MATQEQLKAQLTKTDAPKKPVTIGNFLETNRDKLQQVLPKHMDMGRLERILLFTINSNKAISACTIQSLTAAVIQATQLGLEPGALGHCYFIPYNNNKTGNMELQFQLSYKGLLELVRRSGEISNITAQAVYSNDEFTYELGLQAKLVHKPKLDGDRGKFRAAYAVATFKDGAYAFDVMSESDIESIRKRSKAASTGFSPWTTDYDAMAKKTVLKRLCKYLPISIEIQKGVVADETTKQTYSIDMASDTIDVTDWDTIDVANETASEQPVKATSAVKDVSDMPEVKSVSTEPTKN